MTCDFLPGMNTVIWNSFLADIYSGKGCNSQLYHLNNMKNNIVCGKFGHKLLFVIEFVSL